MPGLLSLLQKLPPEEREKLLSTIDQELIEYAYYDFFNELARPEQQPPSDPNWNEWVFVAGRAAGKLFSPDTPILTTKGFKPFGTIKAGDIVFDDQGHPTTVTNVYRPKQEETSGKMFRLTFSTGETLKTCTDHQWITWTASQRLAHTNIDKQWAALSGPDIYSSDIAPKLRTTQQILDTLYIDIDGELIPNHSIPTAKPLRLQTRCLSPKPYDLGQLYLSHAIDTIPPRYLLSSTYQRQQLLLSLLQLPKKYNLYSNDLIITFHHKDKYITNIVAYLLASLGMKPIITNNEVISFPWDQQSRYIVAAEPIEWIEDSLCITVDSPGSTYLIGYSLIPTHNTRTAAEQVRRWAEQNPNCRIALVAPTASDARDTMITGHSGILSISPPWFMPIYEPSKRRLSWPNGSQAFAFSAEEPDRLRGPQFHFAWGDEVAVWKYDEKTLAMLRFSLRLGKNPQAIYTTTPRPTTLMRQLLKDSPGRYISRGSTYDNKANLPAGYLQQIKEKYEGTRLGRQEIYAELLEDIPGALITPEHILHTDTTPSNITRTEVAIDPAVTNNPNSDSTGIIVAAKTSDNKVYILADYSMKASPEQWARRAIKAYHDFSCDRIIYEGNMGGDLVASTLRAVDNTVRIDKVTASKGKHIRFAPVAALYEQGKVFHVGQYADLEQQLCSFTLDGYCGDGSPDRADAAVYAITSLVLQKKKSHAAALY